MPKIYRKDGCYDKQGCRIKQSAGKQNQIVIRMAQGGSPHAGGCLRRLDGGHTPERQAQHGDEVRGHIAQSPRLPAQHSAGGGRPRHGHRPDGGAAFKGALQQNGKRYINSIKYGAELCGGGIRREYSQNQVSARGAQGAALSDRLRAKTPDALPAGGHGRAQIRHAACHVHGYAPWRAVRAQVGGY